MNLMWDNDFRLYQKYLLVASPARIEIEDMVDCTEDEDVLISADLSIQMIL